jgi:hypothetical protein
MNLVYSTRRGSSLMAANRALLARTRTSSAAAIRNDQRLQKLRGPRERWSALPALINHEPNKMYFSLAHLSSVGSQQHAGRRTCASINLMRRSEVSMQWFAAPF